MVYKRAVALVMAKLRSEEVDDKELLEGLKQHPTIGRRLVKALIIDDDSEDDCPECDGPCKGHPGPDHLQAADKYMEENGIY